VKPDVFRKHRAKFSGEIPLESDNYILNQLIRAARRKGDELLSEYDRIKRRDALEDLKRPWENARVMAKRFEDERSDAVFREELQLVAQHVKDAYDAWIAACRKSDDKEKEKRQKKKQRRSREARDDAMLGVARLYSQGPGDECFLQDLERLKASYAITLSINFALSVAFQTVCDIKAKASSNGYASSERMFDELKNMAPSAMRVLTAETE
jgi:RNA-dependent RNA polymerase